MGIRPHLYAIIGVDNLHTDDNDGSIIDARSKVANFYRTEEFEDLYWSEIPHYTHDFLNHFQCVDSENYEGGKHRRLCYHEVFVYQPEYGLKNVIGCIPPNHFRSMHLHSHGVLYTLAAAFGMPGDKPGYEIISRVDDDEYQLMMRMHGKKLRQQYNHFAYGWFDNDFILSQRILADFGLEFNVDELELLLYWYWS